VVTAFSHVCAFVVMLIVAGVEGGAFPDRGEINMFYILESRIIEKYVVIVQIYSVFCIREYRIT